jgi:gliding motility-associated-like protein
MLNWFRITVSLLLLLYVPTVSAQSSYPANLDFELGNFQNWQCYTGNVSVSGGVNTITVSPTAPIAGRHDIIPATNTSNDQYGNFPVHCPNGSGFSIKLGNNSSNAKAQRVSYTFTIPATANDYSIIYQYAVVLQDPNHTAPQQPRFFAKVYDVATNSYIGCASFDFVATANLPGFSLSSSPGNIWYKPWTPVTINLSGYAGKTIRLEFTSVDCTVGGHFGYAYVDVNTGFRAPVTGASFCPGSLSVTLTAPFGYQGYYWYNSDYSQLLGTGPTLTLSPPPPANTALALAIVPYPGFGCKDTVKVTLKPALPPVADAGLDRTLCKNGSVPIGSAALPGYSYSWFPTTGLNNPHISNPVATPADTTMYVVTVTDSLTGCSITDTVFTNVSPVANAAFSIVNQASQCVTGNSFQFSAVNATASLRWRFGDGTLSTATNPVHSYAADGNYTVSLVSTTSASCVDSSSNPVVVYPIPSGNISSGTSIICEGTPVQLNATGGSSYTWFKDGVAIPSFSSTPLAASAAGVYTAVVIDQNGCTNKIADTITLSLTKKPVADFNFAKYCVGIPTNFTNNSTISNSLPVTYVWNLGSSVQSTDWNPVVTYAAAGEYTVSFSITPQNCPQLTTTAQKIITIENPLKGMSYPPKNAVVNQPLSLTARPVGQTYNWSPSTYLSTTSGASTIYNGTEEKTYRVSFVTAAGCTTVDTQQVKIFKETEVYVPKAFTPNNDGQNDRMYPFLVGIKQLRFFRILNRWGVVVYESKTDLPGWDGSYKGMAQPMDGYNWEAQAVDFNGKIISRQGSFTLIR